MLVAEEKTETADPEPFHPVHNAEHYGGRHNPHETIKVLEAWLGPMVRYFLLGQVIKYVSRAGKKGSETYRQDLEKAAYYLQREIERAKQVEQKKDERG